MANRYEGQQLEKLLVAGTPFWGLPHINHLMGCIRTDAIPKTQAALEDFIPAVE